MTKAEPLLKSAMLGAARACAKAHRVSLKTVSRWAYGDGKFFISIQSGGKFTVASYDKVMAFFAKRSSWPDGKSPEIIDPMTGKAIA